jgi:fluoride ion exporter CrcB/FEX
VTVLLLAVGAGTGAAVRLWASTAVGGRRATLAVNVAGCALLGLLLLAPSPVGPLALGLAGGLTTFSTWAVETVEGGSWRYAVTTTVLCLLAACSRPARPVLRTGPGDATWRARHLRRR